MRVFVLLFLASIVGNAFANTPHRFPHRFPRGIPRKTPHDTPHHTPHHPRTTSSSIGHMRGLLKSAGGCNANVCFALDGSGSVSSPEYELQKNFILDVLAVLAGHPIEVSAVQYGKFAYPISRRTANLEAFTLAVADSHMVGSRFTNIGAGVLWCTRQLYEFRNAKKMVILGDGKNNVRGRGMRSAFRLANKFRRRTGGKVCAVGIGFTRYRKLLKLAGHNPNLVLTVDDYLELSDIIRALVEMVCDVKLH